MLQELSPRQTLAIGCLSMGLSDDATAERVGVHRLTVSRWRLHDEAFRRAFADRMTEIWADSADQLRAMIPKALDALHRALECGDERTRVRAALGLLRIVGRGRCN